MLMHVAITDLTQSSNKSLSTILSQSSTHQVCSFRQCASLWHGKWGCIKSTRPALFKWHKVTIPNIHCFMCVHHFRCNPTSDDIDQTSGMTSWIQGIDASQKSISYISCLCPWRPKWCVMASLLYDSSPPSTVIRQVRDTLNDDAAGLCTVYPSF